MFCQILNFFSDEVKGGPVIVPLDEKLPVDNADIKDDYEIIALDGKKGKGKGKGKGEGKKGGK